MELFIVLGTSAVVINITNITRGYTYWQLDWSVESVNGLVNGDC